MTDFDVADEISQEADELIRIFYEYEENDGFFPSHLLEDIFNKVREDTGDPECMGLGAIYIAGYMQGSEIWGLNQIDRKHMSDSVKILENVVKPLRKKKEAAMVKRTKEAVMAKGLKEAQEAAMDGRWGVVGGYDCYVANGKVIRAVVDHRTAYPYKYIALLGHWEKVTPTVDTLRRGLKSGTYSIK